MIGSTKSKSSKTKNSETRLRDFVVCSNLDLILISIVLAFYHATATVYAQDTHENVDEYSSHGSEHSEEDIEHEDHTETFA